MDDDRLGVEQHAGDEDECEVARDHGPPRADPGAQEHAGPQRSERHPHRARKQRRPEQVAGQPQRGSQAQRVRAAHPPCGEAVERVDQDHRPGERDGVDERPRLEEHHQRREQGADPEPRAEVEGGAQPAEQQRVHGLGSADAGGRSGARAHVFSS